jgi:thiol-disulfide isomerase/thioredoxin
MKTFLLAGLIMLAIHTTAQNKYLEIGDTLPAFSAAISNYEKKIFTNADLKNKLTILDFWTINCGACIAAMPKMKRLKDRYGDALQIILVTPNTTSQVEALAKKNKIVKQNTLPSIVGDSQIFRRFNFQSVPTHIWIDSAGNVRYITEGWDTNDSTITAYLRGADPKIIQKVEDRHFDYKALSQLLIRSSPYASLLQQYSVFLARIEGMRDGMVIETDSLTQEAAVITIINEFPLNLFRYAFKGSYLAANDNRRLILEGETAAALAGTNENYKNTGWRNAHMFTYQLKPPASKRKEALQYMQQDLNRFFGVKARIEKREMPCMALVKLPAWKSKPILQKDTVCGYNEGRLVVRNCTTNRLVYLLNDATINSNHVPVFFDETSIDGTVNIELNIGPMLEGNIEDLDRQLRSFGLTLVPKNELIDVFVIGDK